MLAYRYVRLVCQLTTYRDLVEKYGGMKPAARATGISFGKIQRGFHKENKQLDRPITQRVESTYSHPAYVKPKLVKTLAIFDSHDDPRIDKDRFRWMGYHAKHGGYSHIVHGGDVFDLLSLCSHVKNESYGGRFKGTFHDDIVSGNDALGCFQQESGNIPVFGILGNHDIRAKIYESEHPETNGTMHHALMNVFKSNNWHMEDYGKRLTIEGVDYIHTPFAKGSGTKPLGGQNIMARQAKRIVRPMVFGHNHMWGVYTEEKDDGNHGNVTMINVPCSLPHGFVFDYVGDSPSGWSYGVFEIVTLDGKIVGAKLHSMLELQMHWESR